MGKYRYLETDEFMARLRDIRLKAGVTQEELADVTCIAKGMVSDYERGVHTPSFHRVLEIAWFFGYEVVLRKQRKRR